MGGWENTLSGPQMVTQSFECLTTNIDAERGRFTFPIDNSSSPRGYCLLAQLQSI
jgi:hypothetical protein